MIFVGIDIAKDKHDCSILDVSNNLLSHFSFYNNREGFNHLLATINSFVSDKVKIKIGLEATGHYSYSLLGFLLDNNLQTFVINPLHASLYRKSLSLRKTKTDKVDSRTIAMMLMSDVDLKPYSDLSYHNEELKSLTRYRFSKTQERAKLKVSIKRLVHMLFPELQTFFPSMHSVTVYNLLLEYPIAHLVATSHITKLSNIISIASRGRYDKSFAIELREAARHSVGCYMPSRSMELQHTIHLIREFDKQIADIDIAIKKIMDEISSPITSVPGIGYGMGSMILAEIGDINLFSSPDKLLAFSGYCPSTYQSGNFTSKYSRMEKRGSRYLRYALYNSAKSVCLWSPVFKEYFQKKRSEGKHYNVALAHVVKKLLRLIFSLEKNRTQYV